VSELSGQVTRNTKPIAAQFLALNTVVTEISTSPTLSGQLNSLTANGIPGYEKYTATEGASFVTGLTNYYNANITVPSNSAVATQAQALTSFFVTSNDTVVSTDLTLSGATFVLGAPKFFDLNLAQYQSVIDGSGFTNTNSTWSADSDDVNFINSVADFGKAGLIVVNKIQSTINNRFEGHYVGIADNTNLLANTDHTSIRKIYTTGSSASNGLVVGSGYVEVPTSKLAFPLSATTDSGNNRNSRSLSEILEKVSDSFPDMSSDKFDDTISFGLFKLRTSPYNPDAIKLDFAFEEARTGSFDFYRQINNQNGGIANTFYIENVVNASNNVTTFINSYINGKNSGTWLDAEGVPTKQVRVFSHNSVQALKDSFESNYSKFGFHVNDVATIESYMDYADALFPAGCFSTFTTNGKAIGSLPLKIDRTLRKIENDEIFPLDLVVEAGLGTVFATACANHTGFYDDTQVSQGLIEGLSAMTKNDLIPPTDDRNNLRDNYNTIFQLFANFCENLRKDCLFIADPLRQIFVTGANSLVMSDTTRSFSQYIYNPLRHLFGTANTSYATTYGNWVKVNDMFAGMNIWVPFSPFAAADMANVDQNFEPWYAPAGFIRGKVTNALALAINPSQKNRDMMYKVSVNPVAFFPNDGFNIFGQKTLLRQPSAFDRINVRRLFLYLEKATKRTVKYFVFEPNTLFTRNRVVAVLDPIFERAKNTQGLYSYIIICNSSNNTPTVIDQNELVVDIYLKPVRAAEFILVNFYATSTGANFSELIGQ
jgi:hypothetical protein